MRYLFTSESVTKGHPDKVADQISDAILDACLEQDPNSRCACEVTVEKGACHIMGEVTTTAKVNYIEVARNVIKDIGYTDPSMGFDAKSVNITCTLHEQSSDIAMGVDKSYDSNEQGAGDQGLMFGYASSETEEFMPSALMYARELTDKLTEIRESGELKYLRPDGKAQVTVEYDSLNKESKVKRIDSIVISTSHIDAVSIEKVREDIRKRVINISSFYNLCDSNTKYYINPTGRFVICGPAGDTGLTGRKIVVDTYGGYAPHGGGAFSGKDPSKVDRSASYMARHIAKTIVASGVVKSCKVQLSYAIGVSNPTSIYVDFTSPCFGNIDADTIILNWIKNNFDLTPRGIIETLNLKNPIYRDCAERGHFGNNTKPWEMVDYKKALSLYQQFVPSPNNYVSSISTLYINGGSSTISAR